MKHFFRVKIYLDWKSPNW